MDEQIPLLPKPAIDGPWRADGYGAKLVAARNSQGFEELRLIDYSSLAIYGEFGDPVAAELIQRSMSWAHRQSESIELFPLNRFGVLSSALLNLDDLAYGSDPLSLDIDGLKDLLRSLIGYGREYSELLAERGLIWSPNGRYLLPVIPLTSDELMDPDVHSLLRDLLELSRRTPLRPLLLLEDSRRVSNELRKELSWQAFIGPAQMGYCRDRYAMEPQPGMKTRVAIGLTVDRVTRSIRTLNGINYEPTAEALEKKQAVAEESASYERFLEGLRDGS